MGENLALEKKRPASREREAGRVWLLRLDY
jgi:hypothetical protein